MSITTLFLQRQERTNVIHLALTQKIRSVLDTTKSEQEAIKNNHNDKTGQGPSINQKSKAFDKQDTISIIHKQKKNIGISFRIFFEHFPKLSDYINAEN